MSDGGADTVEEAQGVIIRTVNGAVKLIGRLGKAQVPAESRADVSSHGFWKRGTTAMFDIQIANLDVGSYLCMAPEEALAKAEKDKKGLYLQACLEHRRTLLLWYTLQTEYPKWRP